MKRRSDETASLFPKPRPEELPPCHICRQPAAFTKKNVERPTEPPVHACRDHLPKNWSGIMPKTLYSFFEDEVFKNTSTALGASPAVDQNPFD